MSIFLLMVLCMGTALSQVQVPCYGDGCANVTVYLGPRWGSRVIILPRKNATLAETRTTEAPSKAEDSVNQYVHPPQHKPIPPGDEFRVDLMDDVPLVKSPTTPLQNNRNYYRNTRWPVTTTTTSTARPWINSVPKNLSEVQLVVDSRGTLDLSWRGYTGEDVKQLLKSLSAYDRSGVYKLILEGNTIRYFPVLMFPVEFEYHLQEIRFSHDLVAPYMDSMARFELSRLAHLKVLNMTDCKISTLTMPFIPSLEVLDLSYNRLRYLPLDLDRLSQLRQLFLRGNRISYIYDYPLSSLTNLKVLDLGSNGLLEFSEQPLEHLSSLVTLNLDNNRLTSLPLLPGSPEIVITLENNTLDCSCRLMDWMKNRVYQFDRFARCRDGNTTVFLSELIIWPQRHQHQHLCVVGERGSRILPSLALWYRRNPDIMAVIYKIVGVSIAVVVVVVLLKRRRRLVGKMKPKGIPYNTLDEQQVSTVSGPLIDV